MSDSSIKDRELERQGKRLFHPGIRFVLIGLAIAAPGIVLVAGGWAIPLGAILLAFGSLPITAGVAMLLSATVARWAARHKLFA
jgi:hypothetical protein